MFTNTLLKSKVGSVNVI